MVSNATTRTKNLDLGRKSGVHKNKAKSGNYRIIKFCLPEILALKKLELPNSSSIGLIQTAFHQDISPKAFSSHLNLAQKKLTEEQRGLMEKEIARLLQSKLSEISEQFKIKGSIYASTQRKTKAKVEVSPVAPAQAVEARPAPQIQRVLAIPAPEIVKAPSAPLVAPVAPNDGLITLPSKAPAHIQKMEDDFTQRTGINQGMKERAALMNYIAQHYDRLFELQQQTIKGENKTWQKELTDFSNAQKR